MFLCVFFMTTATWWGWERPDRPRQTATGWTQWQDGYHEWVASTSSVWRASAESTTTTSSTTDETSPAWRCWTAVS